MVSLSAGAADVLLYLVIPSLGVQATDSLRENWGDYMTECTFNWRMMKYIFTGAWLPRLGAKAGLLRRA